MNRHPAVRAALAAALLLPLAGPVPAWAYDSGSTGADGALDVTIDTTLPLPPDGVFNYTDVNVAAGATLRFTPNAANTPVTILASGNVNIAGTIDISGEWGTPAGAAGDGNLGDDGIPGAPGPGGFRGGSGYPPINDTSIRAEHGIGPGGGQGGLQRSSPYTYGGDGGGGGFGSAGISSRTSYGGPTYGTEALLPLIGGSGGGGGIGGTLFHGSGGGGGGGAILIAASEAVDITGTIYANGGTGGPIAGTGVGGSGGGGSGGAIRIVATTLSGNGGLYAKGAPDGAQDRDYGHGGNGRIRLEAETILRTAGTDPAFTFGNPTSAFVAGMPTLRITSVGGITAPTIPTGDADISLPADTPNPVTVEIATTGVPVGNTVKVTVVPTNGTNTTSATTPALTGTIDAATASVAVDLPTGPSTLMAETTYTIVASLGDTLAPLAGGERVERVRLAAAMNGPATVTLITVSGKEYRHPAGRIPRMPAG
ncbi:hypothetical protein [Endothiovibrio diazotrophicus]